MVTERPVFAATHVTVGSQRVRQRILFRYADPSENYHTFERLGTLDAELEEILLNLQGFLDQDELTLNDRVLSLYVTDVQLRYFERRFTAPELCFTVRSSPYRLRVPGPQILVLDSARERVDYPCLSVWRFPAPVVAVRSPNQWHVEDCRLSFHAEADDFFGGREKFVFRSQPSEGPS